MRTEIKYGIITGLAGAAYIMGEYWLGFHEERIEYHPVVTMFGFIVPILGLYFGIKEKRDKDFNGYIRYWQGVRTGIYISFVTAIVAVIFQLIYHWFINPDFHNTMIEFARERALQEGLSTHEVEARVEAARSYHNTTSYLFQVFFGSMVIGLFISLIEAAFLKRKSEANV